MIGCSDNSESLLQDEDKIYEFRVISALGKTQHDIFIAQTQSLFFQINSYLGANRFRILSDTESPQHGVASIIEIKEQLDLYPDKAVMGYANSSRNIFEYTDYQFHWSDSFMNPIKAKTTINVVHSMNIVLAQDWIQKLLPNSSESLPPHQFHNLLLHEIGHGIGLNHVEHNNHIMYEEISKNKQNLDAFFAQIKRQIF